MIHALMMLAAFAVSLWVAYACLRQVFAHLTPHEPSAPPRPTRHTVRIHRHGEEDLDDEPRAPLAEASAAAPRMH